MTKKQSWDPANWLRTIIKDFITDSPENTLRESAHEKVWINPLVGFSRGDDPLYDAFKKHIGPFHWMPQEIFTRTFPEITVNPEDLTVISWVLCHTESTRADNQRQNTYPSERWARSRLFGENANNKLRHHVVSALHEKGYRAIAPVLSPLWSQQTSNRYGYASTWSERHAAYASGLGTFGLSDGLITERGQAVRIGSVIACINIPPTHRPYDDPHAYCLFFAQGICKKCIPRCPAGAITEAGHDKQLCFDHCYGAAKDYIKSTYKIDAGACGLCQTKVPCESKIPVKKDSEINKIS